MIRRWWRAWWPGVTIVILVASLVGFLWWQLPTCDEPWIIMPSGSSPVVICR